MADDVVVKVIAANDVVNGAVVTGVDRVGNYHDIDPTNNENENLGPISGVYHDRFDDYRYYSGDTSS